MTRRVLTTAMIFAALLLTGVDLGAHERFRLVGTISRLPKGFIEIKLQIGRTVAAEIDKKTVVMRDKKVVPIAELKTGLTVVVDALGDDDTDLVAQKVTIVPALPPAKPPVKK